ncbi:MAG TPA: 50S ribosomal protein L22 [Alphaproteobacteria bacterium]|nr:50S ribosomal protein L22 [Alphaproteobacteria bacterium]
MEARAILRHARISPFKTRPVADLVRGKPVEQAYAILRYTPLKASRLVSKLIRSAVANAEGRGASSEDLFVSQIYVDQGPSLKRWRPRAFGRANRVLKRTSHITVYVADSADSANE